LGRCRYFGADLAGAGERDLVFRGNASLEGDTFEAGSEGDHAFDHFIQAVFLALLSQLFDHFFQAFLQTRLTILRHLIKILLRNRANHLRHDLRNFGVG